MKHHHNYYWACGLCGASPIKAANGQRIFASEQQAVEAGKPAECSNVYCHTRPRSPYYIGEDRMTVHGIHG